MSGPEFLLAQAKVAAILGPVVAAFVIWRWRRRGGRRGPIVFGVIAAIGWSLWVWAWLIEPATLTVRHVSIESVTWSGPPVRIGVISDTHVAAPRTDVARVRKLVSRMNAERPDVVVLLGDYAGGHEPAAVRARPEQSEILRGVTAFGALRAPLGVFGVLGNHDSWFDESALAESLRRAGVEVLENQAVEVQRRGAPFWIGGVADLQSRRLQESVPETLAAVPAGAPVIALTHWPDPFEEMPPRVALTLAGHTHCGQVVLPIVGRLVHASRASEVWPCGAYDVDGRKLFVTGGVGVSILPVRFRAPPEIVIVTLRAPTLASREPRP